MTDNPLRISCADAVELATDYLEHALHPTDVDDYTTHLSQCQGCQVFLDQIRTTVHVAGNLRGSTSSAVPQVLRDRLRRRLA